MIFAEGEEPLRVQTWRNDAQIILRELLRAVIYPCLLFLTAAWQIDQNDLRGPLQFLVQVVFLQVVDDADVVDELAAGAPNLVGRLLAKQLVVPGATLEVRGSLAPKIRQLPFPRLVQDAYLVVRLDTVALLQLGFD